MTTMAEIDGESTYKLFIGGRLVGQFTNPKTSEDYKPTLKTWNNVRVDKGAMIRVEFNTATLLFVYWLWLVYLVNRNSLDFLYIWW